MKVTVSKSKNTTLYYISKSVRINGKSTSKIIERLGTIDEIRARAGSMDPLEWAKQYAAELTRREKEGREEHIIKYSASERIPKDQRRKVNVGYLFVQDLYYALGLHTVCNSIADRSNFSFDLNEILSRLIYTRIMYPSSKRSSLQAAQQFLEGHTIQLQQVYRALSVLAEHQQQIQAQVYRNSQRILPRNQHVLYYDCTNYYFEIEQEDLLRRYGYSKEHRPNPIVQMGLIMDADGIPMTFSIFPGNENEQPSLQPLEKQIIDQYGTDRFVICTDAGLASTLNRKFNNTPNRRFITTQPVKKLKAYLRDFVLADDGWYMLGTPQKKYKLSELDETRYADDVFYKDRWINEDGLEQHLIVSFSFRYRNYQREVRNRQVERAKKTVKNGMRPPRQNDFKRFVLQRHCTKDGEIASKTYRILDKDRIDEEGRYDGFYAVCTNLEDGPETIIQINRRRWEIEECFRIMKYEFKARPVYLSRADRITAHFLTCFLALILFRMLEKRLGNAYTCQQIRNTLCDMDMLEVPGEGFLPAYTRTDLTDALHDAFGFHTDFQIVSAGRMKKICSGTKK